MLCWVRPAPAINSGEVFSRVNENLNRKRDHPMNYKHMRNRVSIAVCIPESETLLILATSICSVLTAYGVVSLKIHFYLFT